LYKQILAQLQIINTNIERVRALLPSAQLDQIQSDLTSFRSAFDTTSGNIQNMLVNMGSLAANVETNLAEMRLLAEDVDRENHHETHIFPSRTNVACILACGAVANTWSAWNRLLDANGVALDARGDEGDMHITAIQVETAGIASERYMCEVSYGPDNITITRLRLINGVVAVFPGISSMRIHPAFVPVGSRIYYRGMSETGASSMSVSIRYHFHNSE